MKILLVEDDPDIRAIYKKMLSNYDVEAIADGGKAVRLYKEIQPDVVLMDIVLEGSSGIEIAKEILNIDRDAKIIAITAYARENREKILESGIVEILEKPFRMKNLLELVEKYGRK